MSLDRADRRLLVRWATDCAERVLPLFETHYPDDLRPRNAIEAARAWVRDELAVSDARAAALAAHAAARDAKDTAVMAAARAAGHAAATAHVAEHAGHAAAYAVKAIRCVDGTADIGVAAATKERDWQIRHLPEHLRDLLRTADDNG